MAAGTEIPLQNGGSVVQPPPSEQELFIEQRLTQAQRHVKGVDLAVGLIVLAIGLLGYLLGAALIDHWVAGGGLGIGGRAVLWFGMLVAGGTYAYRAVLPSLIYRINPIFAARTIEQSRPSLKNSLINFLMMRGHRREVQPVVYRALEQRAVSDLSHVELETAVDRRHVIRLGYVLAGMLAVFCLYLVMSPKSPLTSAARIMLPWADISAPTRVTIEEIRPGDMTGDGSAFHGESVLVSAEVEGLDEGEAVMLYFSTGDGSDVDRALPMTIPNDAYRHQCELPADARGLQQDIEYYLKAGDCTTERFTIEVRTAPAILVESIHYDYPAYTGIADRTVRQQGDIRAIEGTKITLKAKANQEIQRAEIDFDCDSLRGRKMAVDGNAATGRFTLELDADDPTLPWHDCYQLRFTDRAGRENRRPIRHEIAVIRDLPPQVQLVEPQEEEVELPADGQLEIHVRAEDPDYRLSRVELHIEHAGRELNRRPLLDAPHEGEFLQTYLFDPTRLGLEPGSRVLYWAEAEDDKRPDAGMAETPKQWINIVEPDTRGPAEPRPNDPQSDPSGQDPRQPRQEDPLTQDPSADPSPQRPRPEEPPAGSEADPPAEVDPSQPQPGEQQPDEPQSGDQQSSESGLSSSDQGDSDQGDPNQAGSEAGTEESSEPLNRESQPGEVFEEVLEHMKEQQEEQDSDQQQSGEQNGSEQTGTEQTGTEQSGTEQSGTEQTGTEEAGTEQTGAEQTGTEQTGTEQTGTEQTGTEQTGTEQTGTEQTGTEQTGTEQTGTEQTGTEQTGTEQTGTEQTGTEQTGTEQTGSEQTGTEQTGTERPDTESTGTGDPSKSEDCPKCGEPLQSPDATQCDHCGNQQGPTQNSSNDKPGESKTQSGSSGDRSGEGERGAGQQSDNQGTGTPGSNTESDNGGAASAEQGEGPEGQRGGTDAETDQQTGTSAPKPDGDGTGERPGRAEDDGSPGTPQQNPTPGGRPGDRESEGPSTSGHGEVTHGGQGSNPTNAEGPAESVEPGGDDPNLEYARKQTDLALQHIEEQLAKQEPDQELLDRLGWTRDDLAQFAKQWEKMKRAAARRDAQGQAAREDLDEAIKSLGLRPGGTRLDRGGMETDRLEGMREASRHEPPGDWSELLRAYNRGIAGGDR